MALIKGSNAKSRPYFNRSDSSIHRRQYKADYRPKEKYSTSTKNVGGFVLHEVQVASPQSLKEAKEKVQDSTANKSQEQENILQTDQDNLENVPVEQYDGNFESPLLNYSLESSVLLNRIVKRKRGRPRKISTELSAELVTIDENTFNAEMLTHHSPPPQPHDSAPM